MRPTIEYFLVPNSPWTYLGHERFAQIAAAAGAGINVLPVDLGGDQCQDGAAQGATLLPLRGILPRGGMSSSFGRPGGSAHTATGAEM